MNCEHEWAWSPDEIRHICVKCDERCDKRCRNYEEKR